MSRKHSNKSLHCGVSQQQKRKAEMNSRASPVPLRLAENHEEPIRARSACESHQGILPVSPAGRRSPRGTQGGGNCSSLGTTEGTPAPGCLPLGSKQSSKMLRFPQE